MKQIYRLIAMMLCIAMLTACGGNTADSEDGGQSSIGGSASPEQDPASPQEPSPLDLAKESNADTVAWLKIPNTDIDHPVMQTADNETYLRHNEKKEYDVWGCYFADYYANLTDAAALCQNTVIYGHSQSSENPRGKRFTQLFHYLEPDFLKENPNIYLTVGDQELTFQIFAVFFTHTDFYYIDPKPSDQGFDRFLSEVNDKNEFVFDGVTVTEQDKLLTLSCCAFRYDTAKTGDHRLVVMAKLVEKDAQSPEITENPNPQRP